MFIVGMTSGKYTFIVLEAHVGSHDVTVADWRDHDVTTVRETAVNYSNLDSSTINGNLISKDIYIDDFLILFKEYQ